MLKIVQFYVTWTNRVNDWIGMAVSWLTSALVLVVCYDVFTRYVLKKSSIAVQELEWHIFAALFLLGAAYTLRHNKHVRVDLFYTQWPKRVRAAIDFFGAMLFILPFAVVVIWMSKDFVMTSFNLRETSPDPGGLGGRYILKAVIPISFVLLAAQALAMAGEALIDFVKGPDDPDASESTDAAPPMTEA